MKACVASLKHGITLHFSQLLRRWNNFQHLACAHNLFSVSPMLYMCLAVFLISFPVASIFICSVSGTRSESFKLTVDFQFCGSMLRFGRRNSTYARNLVYCICKFPAEFTWKLQRLELFWETTRVDLKHQKLQKCNPNYFQH